MGPHSEVRRLLEDVITLQECDWNLIGETIGRMNLIARAERILADDRHGTIASAATSAVQNRRTW